MDQCLKKRQQIALQTIGALDAEQSRTIQEHLANCQECRRYAQEISQIANGLAAAKGSSQIEASEAFCRKLDRKLCSAQPESVLQVTLTWVRESMLTWRVAVPAVAVIAAAVFLVIILHSPSPSPAPLPAAARIQSVHDSSMDIAPTIANYQLAASQSLDDFSNLLTKQGNKKLPPAPLESIFDF